MSAPHIILDNLPSFAKNCQIWLKFDIVITKIILFVFLRHGVVIFGFKNNSCYMLLIC